MEASTRLKPGTLVLIIPIHRIACVLAGSLGIDDSFMLSIRLKLTPLEIAGLTKWKGTRWAKKRHEQEEGITIRDTIGDCVHDWVDPELRRPYRNAQQPQGVQEEKIEAGEGDMEEDMDDGDKSDTWKLTV